MAYLTDIQAEAAMAALAAAHPNRCELIPLPFEGISGSPCHALRIGKPTGSAYGVLICGGMHGDERGPTNACMQAATDLLDANVAGSALAYGGFSITADEVSAIVNGIDVLVVPVVNPYGLRNGTRKNGRGVDINRNFDFLWDTKRHFDPGLAQLNDNTTASSAFYHGTSANSEPETQNLISLMQSNPQVRMILDIHSSASPCVIYGWSDDETQSDFPDMNFRNPVYDGTRGLLDGHDYREYMPAAQLSAATLTGGIIANAMNAVGAGAYPSGFGAGFYPQGGIGGVGVDYFASRQFVVSGAPKVQGFGVELENQSTWTSSSQGEIDAGAAAIIAVCNRTAQISQLFLQLVSEVVSNFDVSEFSAHLFEISRNRPKQPIPGPDPAAARRKARQRTSS